MAEPDDREFDELEVERRVRASLDAHAGEVDTTVSLRIGRPARRRRWVVAGAVAAVAAAVVAVTVPIVVLGGDEPTRTNPSPASEVPSPTDARWRTELWHGVSVDVPATWEWGAGPRGRSLSRCGRPHDQTTPYVGRPLFLSDACIVQLDPDPQAPYVWLDASIEPGTLEVGTDYVQVTVERAGTTVTVGSDDEALRNRILSSVAAQRACPATIDPDDPMLVTMPIDGTGELESFQLCAYTPADGTHALVYGRELTPADYAAFREASDDAPESARRCKAPGDLVLLRATSDDVYGDEPVSRTWLADVTCGQLTSTAGLGRLTGETIASWSDPGLRAVLPYYSRPWR